MKYRFGGSPGKALTGATLGFFFGFAAVALFGTTAKMLQSIMGLTTSQVGLLVAIPALSGSLLRIPFGAWVDKDGGRKPFLILLFLALIGMIGLSAILLRNYPSAMTQSTYWLLMFFGLLSGCGIAVFSVGTSQVSYWFPQSRQGFASGAFGGLGNLAPGIFSFLLPMALAVMSLPGAYILWTVILFIGFVIYFIMGRNAPYFQAIHQGASPEQARKYAENLYARPNERQELFPSGGVMETLKASASNIHTWILTVLYFVTFGGFMALTSWLPTFWQSLFGYSVATAGFLTAGYSIITSLIRVPGGRIADRAGGVRSAMISVIILGLGAIITAYSHNLPLTLIGMLFMAAGMGVNNAAVFKLLPRYIPEAIGGASGWVGGIGAFGGFVLPPVMAAFVNRSGMAGYRTGFLVFVVLAFVCVLLLWYLGSKDKEAD